MEKYLMSSVDREKLSLTIKGVGVAIIPVVIFLGQSIGLGIAEADLTELFGSFATLVSAGMIFAGLVRKVIVKLKK